jgi:hypothetical protein
MHMRVGPRPAPVILNSYSLTGDLLSFDRCPLQYRLFTRTGVRQSHPVQQWYGNFLHLGMRRAYDAWKENPDLTRFLWSEPLAGDYGELVEAVTARLQADGLFRPSSMGAIAENRLLRAIRVLGPLVFPLIKEAEVKLSAVRQAETEQGEEIAYQITGVVDVLAATRFTSDTDNPLVAYVMKRLDELGNTDEELEVILDYKGIARGEVDDAGEMASRQILTYSWLRNRRLRKKVVAAGAVVFVNDLLAAGDDPNVDPTDEELDELLDQAIVPVAVGGSLPEEAAEFFDARVEQIEAAQVQEAEGAVLEESWPPRPKKRTCVACDARYHCPSSAANRPKRVVGVFAPAAP